MSNDPLADARRAGAQLRQYGVTDDFMNLDCADPTNVPPPRYADLSPKKTNER